MKKNLQRILAMLCVLALAIGVAAVSAEEETEARVITINWVDGNNADQLRPDSIKATLGGQSVQPNLNAGNGWTGEVLVPVSTSNEWGFEGIPNGYEVSLAPGDLSSPSTRQLSVLTLSYSVAPTIEKEGTVAWSDGDDSKGIRPGSVQLMLLADGEPFGEPDTAKAPDWKVTWKNLPQKKQGSSEYIEYTVKQLQTPEGYTATYSGMSVTNTMQLANLKLSAAVSGVPEGADVSGLKVTVDGPDPAMPQTLTWGQISGGYDFGQVLPGAYLVTMQNADGMIEGYTMDPANSKVADAKYVKANESATLEFKYAWKEPEAIDVDEDYDPMANIGSLTFEILGPDPRMPITLNYSDFKNGKYELPDLVPGVYTVVERNAETLVDYYVLTGDSITGVLARVEADSSTIANLYNRYVVAPTPEPDAEFVDIPVTKTWNDDNNKDGNRPESITVRLFADGVEVDSHVLTAAEKWFYTFTDKPRYQEDNKTEIVYTVNEDAVTMYTKEIRGYNVVNDYNPEVTSASVRKVWDDKANALKLRPTSIGVTLSDGFKTVTTVVLSDANGWSATVNNLPTIVNGQPAVYTWKEQAVLSYNEPKVEQKNGVTTFTNTIWKRPEEPGPGKKPKTPGDVVTIEEYETPLGVEIVINHVGDCFD